MRRFLIYFFVGLSLLAISACASVNSKVYSSGEISKISDWLLEFSYESGSVETTKNTTGDGEIKVIRSGQFPSDLQLRDDLFYMLKDDYSIPMTKETTASTGKILIHPIHFRRSGKFKSLAVTLNNSNGETLARLKIKNGDRKATSKDDEEFAEYAADAIAQAIEKK